MRIIYAGYGHEVKINKYRLLNEKHIWGVISIFPACLSLIECFVSPTIYPQTYSNASKIEFDPYHKLKDVLK